MPKSSALVFVNECLRGFLIYLLRFFRHVRNTYSRCEVLGVRSSLGKLGGERDGGGVPKRGEEKED